MEPLPTMKTITPPPARPADLVRMGLIENRPVWRSRDGGYVLFTGDADIDCDGGSNPLNDPYWQPDTSLRFAGKSIDAETVPFIVVPPLILKGVPGVVLGCKARVTHTVKRTQVDCVVADIGPMFKVGEVSVAAAKLLGINPHPIKGGEDAYVCSYELWPDVPAEINGITYRLQP